jgi:hypothetical protein
MLFFLQVGSFFCYFRFSLDVTFPFEAVLRPWERTGRRQLEEENKLGQVWGIDRPGLFFSGPGDVVFEDGTLPPRQDHARCAQETKLKNVSGTTF